MAAMFTNIGTVVSKVMNLLGTVTTSLLSNEIFQVTLGMVFLSIVIGLIMFLVSKAHHNSKLKRMMRDIKRRDAEYNAKK